MKYVVVLALAAGVCATALAQVEVRGMVYTGRYSVRIDSVKFATTAGIVTFVVSDWGGGAYVRDTATFHTVSEPTFFGVYYSVNNQTPDPVQAPFVRDSVYALPIGNLPPQAPFPDLTWLPAGGLEEEHSSGLSLGLLTQPNPFVGSTTVRYALAQSSPVQVEVCDRSGRVVHTLHSGCLAAGQQIAVWDGRDASGERVQAGVYLVRVSAGAWSESRRLVKVD